MGEAAARRASSTREEALATLGPEAWPDPGGAGSIQRAARRAAPAAHAAARPAHDRRHRPLVGGRDPVGGPALAVQARRRPRPRRRPRGCARRSSRPSARALEHYERVIELPIPDKLPMPLQIHRHEGEPCPRCATTLRAVHFEDYVDRLLPHLPDRGPGAEGPAAFAAVEVGRLSHGAGQPIGQMGN